VGAKVMDESVRLLVFQPDLEKDLEGRVEVVGFSVNATIQACLVNGQPRRARGSEDLEQMALFLLITHSPRHRLPPTGFDMSTYTHSRKCETETT